MTRQEVKDSLIQAHYDQKEVRSLIDKVEMTKTFKPNQIRVGDVTLQRVGEKLRPCVVIKTVGVDVILVPMSTTNDSMVIMPCSGRFFEKSYFTKAIVTMPQDLAIGRFAGVYGKLADIVKLKKALKRFFNL